ncbi:MAG: hypothetical protein U9R53_11850, partial [Chloroflexota bacterium]|nr:hypothetical protein [Chloroflexota bacterium]
WLNQKLEINIFTTGFVKLSDSFIMAAQWLNQNIEINIFTMGFMRLGDSFTKIAAWIQENAEQGFENAWSWIGQKFMKVSKGAFYLFEQETPEKTGKLMNEALNSLQEYERNVLKIRLRWDLALIPLFLIIILVFLFIF